MEYVLYVIAGAFGLFMLGLFATQCWRLGQHLKTRWPVMFRLYVMIWLAVGMLSCGVMWEQADVISQKKYTDRLNACILKRHHIAGRPEYPVLTADMPELSRQIAIQVFEADKSQFELARADCAASL